MCEDTHKSSIKYFYLEACVLQQSWYCKIISAAQCKIGGNHGHPFHWLEEVFMKIFLLGCAGTLHRGRQTSTAA